MIVAWSYRFAFFSDAFALVLQAFLFYFVGLLVDDSKLPEYGASEVSYMQFVVVGIALAAFVQVGLGRVSAAMRQEQMQGTLEAILSTPTSPATIQLGSVVYDLVYVPLRRRSSSWPSRSASASSSTPTAWFRRSSCSLPSCRSSGDWA